MERVFNNINMVFVQYIYMLSTMDNFFYEMKKYRVGLVLVPT